MKKTKLLAILLTVVLVLALAACGGGNASESGGTADTAPAGNDTETPAENAAGETDMSGLTVGVVMKSFDEFQQSCMQGAKDAALALGIPESNITMVAPNNEGEIMAQVEMVEDLIAKNVDILVISVNQADTLMNALNEAAAKGITIAFADTDAPNFAEKVCFIGTDNEDAAYTGALEFIDTLEEGSNVVILRGKLGDVNHEARTVGLTKALEENGHTVLEVQDANCESDKAAAAMEAWLTKYPAGGIDAVMVTSDSMAIGAAQAIKGAGRLDEISICGFDGFQAAIDLVESGEIEMIIAQKPYGMGYDAVMAAVDNRLNGTAYDTYINPGIEIIDGSNYAQYR